MHPWVHAAQAGALSTDGFVVIKNIGKEPERLLGASVDGALGTGLMQLIPGGPGGLCRLAAGIEIAPGATIELKPGRSGFMFGKLAKTLRQDLYVNGVLTFEKAGAIKVEFFIEAADAPSSSHQAVADCAAAATQ